MQLGFDRASYADLVSTWRAKSDRVFDHMTSPDFPMQGGRQAQRAYTDALRDLIAPTFTGFPVVRLAVPDRSLACVVEQLRRALPSP